MSNRVSPQRQKNAIAVIGGPSTVIDLAGLRIIVDPTFDPAGPQDFLTRLVQPAAREEDLGLVDIALVSHDLHPDNLDTRGRAFAMAAPHLLTGPISSTRLGAPATGLATWESYEVPRADGVDGSLRIVALPAVHGPQDGERDKDGNVNCEVTGFLLSGDDLPTVYVSGDNASIAAVTEIARKYGPVDVAVLFMGAARVPAKFHGRLISLSAQLATAAAVILGANAVIPAHCDSWAHFTEGHADVERAFNDAGLSSLLRLAAPAEWVPLDF